MAPGHGQHAPVVLQVVLHAVEAELALDAVAGAAHAGALGAAALDHEARDDPVEDQAVIEAAVGQGDEVVHGVGAPSRGTAPRLMMPPFSISMVTMGLAIVSGSFSIHRFAVFIARSISRLASFSGGGVPLVIELFALAQAHLHLHPGALEVDGQGNQGIAVLLDLGRRGA